MNYPELVRADRRLVILRLLAKSEGYSANEHLLRTAAGTYGHKVSSDALRTDLAWLQEQGLLLLEQIADITVATLTARGNDVQAGLAHVPGVKRPEAG